MSGKNFPTLDMPPGIWRVNSPVAVGARWYDGNLVRWHQGMMMPVGGWANFKTIPGSGYPIRAAFSWFDNVPAAWSSFGSIDKAHSVKTTTLATYDITPVDLVWSPISTGGYGTGFYGAGAYGSTPGGGGGSTPYTDAIWHFDNFGSLLLAVHTQDGRLFKWDPNTPSTPLVPVAGAPLNNATVIVTDERHVMVMGGVNNPRRIKWCSKEDINDWTATATNSAGGYELDSSGTIIAAAKFPGGILVFTDVDVHLLTYIGYPGYYAKQKITTLTGIVSPYAFAPTPNGVIWLGSYDFWQYNGAVGKVECSLRSEVFSNSNLSRPAAVFAGLNKFSSEVWFFMPALGEQEPSKAVYMSYEGQLWWGLGQLERTAWLNPCWTSKPIAARRVGSDNNLYNHETGYTDDGDPRTNIFAESGDITTDDADRLIKVDRVWPDSVEIPIGSPPGPSAYEITFGVRDSAQSNYTSVGPITFADGDSFTSVRFGARMVKLKVHQISDQAWGLGKLMFRMKPGGKRGR